jgi:hypothetical protein
VIRVGSSDLLCIFSLTGSCDKSRLISFALYFQAAAANITSVATDKDGFVTEVSTVIPGHHKGVNAATHMQLVTDL